MSFGTGITARVSVRSSEVMGDRAAVFHTTLDQDACVHKWTARTPARQNRLRMAEGFGATSVVNSAAEDAVARVLSITEGAGSWHETIPTPNSGIGAVPRPDQFGCALVKAIIGSQELIAPLRESRCRDGQIPPCHLVTTTAITTPWVGAPPRTTGVLTPTRWCSNLAQHRTVCLPRMLRRRLRAYGPNEVREHQRLTRARVLVNQLRNPLLLVLIFAAAASALTGEWVDAVIVVVIVLATVEHWIHARVPGRDRRRSPSGARANTSPCPSRRADGRCPAGRDRAGRRRAARRGQPGSCRRRDSRGR